MLRINILASACLLVLLLVSAAAWPCPYANYKGNVFSDQVIIALGGGTIPIQDDLDTQCYNYSLPYTFNKVPEVAISVFDFEAEASNNLFFYIKTVRSTSLATLPFIVRTQSSYTQWNRITFSFLAEDRNDIQSGYYQIDAGSLSGCDNGKNIDVILPFRTKFTPGILIKHNLFLHGFEVTTIKSGNTRSPFELQIVASSANVTGVLATFSVTTITTINSIYVSYVAFQTSSLSIVGGGFVYDAIQNSSASMYYAPQNNIPRNFARIFGLTGFLLNYDRQIITLSTRWDGYAFNFDFSIGNKKSLLQYFSFSYIFFTGSQCQDCVSYPIFYNSTCISVCPVGTGQTADGTCINCGTGKQWNGTACVIICPTGQYLNPVTNNCQCPPTLNWNGNSCIPCLNGRAWNATTRSCECAKPLQWNGYTCAKVDACTNGKVWDVYTYSCQCPETTFWNGNSCITLPKCQGGQIIDSNYQCSCPNNYVWFQNGCIYSPCVGGQIWTGSKCVCPAGLNFNGTMCLQCINGQKWDPVKLTCSCDSGYQWNGQYCEISYSCSAGRVWNPTYQQCICPDGYYWSGYNCLQVTKCEGGQYFDTTISKCACLSGFQWNGKVCVQCKNGKTWNVTSLSCTCPLGTIEVKDGCVFQQQCSGGKQWNQNAWNCECPSFTVWNGNYCISNPCPNGRLWNDTIKSCQCPGNKVWINQTCVPPQVSCNNGQVWSAAIYACQCPDGTYQGPSSCLPIPICTGGQVYNPLYNQCQCPFGMNFTGGSCSSQKCPANQYFNYNSCQVINCPPPTFFKDNKCVSGGNDQCQTGYIWNGVKCVYSPYYCPEGTSWINFTCQSNGQCGNGFYGNSGNCQPFPQRCIPPSQWDGTKCAIAGTGCPSGTYSQGNQCLPYTQCQNGYVWDSNFLRCVCPQGLIDTGRQCISCSNGQQWISGIGCVCPDGTFDTGAACTSFENNRCSAIANAIWSNNKCLCRPGFIKVGLQCVCYGTQTGTLCDRCSHKPNSRWVDQTGKCQCNTGYTEISNQCVANNQPIGNQDPTKCNTGSYFDTAHRMCLACPDGCLSCQNCYTCNLCRPEFYYNPVAQTCIEFCGDGKRFTSECDDGNNNDGDGCSRDCKIETGYQCSGGSSTTADSCYYYRPNQVTFETLGQIRKTSSVIINIKLNYLPSELISSSDCSNKCNQILVGTITTGDKSSISISAEYLAGTKYIFVITIEFGKPYIAPFTLRCNINSDYTKYFGSIPIQSYDISVQPSYLSAVSDVDTLS